MAYSRAFPILIRKRAGDTIFFEIELLTDASGDPVSTILGNTVRFTLLADPADAYAARLPGSKTSTDVGSLDAIIYLVGRLARWKITAAESAALPVSREIYWDIQITDPFGNSKTLRAGRLLLDPQPTKVTP